MSLRVLLIMDPVIPVPPLHYGGIERVIADLADGLHKRGHDVELWAAPGSKILGRCVPFGRQVEWTRWSNVRNIATLSFRLRNCKRHFDIIHNFGRLAYLTAVLRSNIVKIQTYMRPVNPRNMRLAQRLGGRRIYYTAVSRAIQRTGSIGGGHWTVIYNCASASEYSFSSDVDPICAPLVFLGRLERCKGAHTAILVAKRLQRQLIIAGNRSSLRHELEYFREEIEPHIDGQLIRYVGPIDNSSKNTVLGNAAALLLPVEWEEPFPVVLPEALLCGTPIVAFRRGGLPEGVDHGVTGFLCDTMDEMALAVGELSRIDRSTCRRTAIQRFSDEAVVNEYEQLYYKLVNSQ